jgi:AcrR family transcriptional regulator
MPRLSRKEKQERTRTKLMRSAGKVFCRHGMERASIDAVAEDAGYTKGAFYANFKSKEELFLAMLDESFGERLAEIEQAFASRDESPPDQARHAAADYTRALRADPDKQRLFLEFTSFALRDAGFREELLTRFATMRSHLERIYQRRADEYGLELDIPMDRIVRMVLAIVDGWLLWHLLEPDEVDDALLEEMTGIFTTGIGVVGGALERN